MDYFTDLIATFLDIEHGCYIAVYGGSESSRNESRLLICVPKMSEGLTGLEQHESE